MSKPLKLLDGGEQRFDFGHFVDRSFWALLTAAALYSASTMQQLSKSVTELNEKMAVVVSQLSDQSRRADAQDRRLERLEGR